MNTEIFEMYTDFLIASLRLTSAVGLSEMTEGRISHDKVSRLLRNEEFSSKDLWEYVKPIINKIKSIEGLLIFDDSIEKKPYTDENDIIAWHYDHTTEKNVKGINFITGLYYSSKMSIPVCYELIKKTEKYIDKKTGKEKRKSKETKNEILKRLIKNCTTNKIVFSHILFDSWYSSSDNMEYIKTELKKNFITSIKSNRNVALSRESKLKGQWVKVESLKLEKNKVKEIYIEGISFPLLIIKQVFKNKDDSEGILYLVTSDLSLTFEGINTIYKKRWKVEEFYKSLKQNASLEKSPTKTMRTQSNHFFASMCAFVKLEILKIKTNLNHFAIKAKLYKIATKYASIHLSSLYANSA